MTQVCYFINRNHRTLAGLTFAESRKLKALERDFPSLTEWDALAAAAIAAVIITVAIPYINPPRDLSRPNLIASLAADGSDVKYLAVYDAARRDVGLSHVSGARAPGKDFEL